MPSACFSLSLGWGSLSSSSPFRASFSGSKLSSRLLPSYACFQNSAFDFIILDTIPYSCPGSRYAGLYPYYTYEVEFYLITLCRKGRVNRAVGQMAPFTPEQATYSASDDATAAAIVRNCLQRRASALKRIGVRYQIPELCDPKEWAALKV